jgi:uncharacterized protein (TIGR02687 family)
MANQIEQSLIKRFEKHRIVFWYDHQKKLRAQFDELDLPGITKVLLDNNAFAIKYRILRAEPEQQFLLYHEGPPPEDLENWLLDVQLAHGEFRTDQVGIWLAEMELDLVFADLVQQHLSFFGRKENRQAFRARLKPDDTVLSMRLKMLAICCRAEDRFEDILEKLLLEYAEAIDTCWQQVETCDLEPFFWQQMQRTFNYEAETPGLQDFVYVLFKDCYAMSVGGVYSLNNDALVFMKRWQDSVRYRSSFEKLSKEAADALDIKQKLQLREIPDLIEVDYFCLIDQKILSDLVGAVVNKTISYKQVHQWVMARRSSYWYDQYAHLYEATEQAALLFQTLGEQSLHISNLTEGVKRYADNWYKIDQMYRKYVYHVMAASHTALMHTLSEQVENYYVNQFLLQLGDTWQAVVDRSDRWDAPPHAPQNSFFDRYVQPFLSKANKVCVIISDGMRYEIGEELLSLICREDRFTGEIDAMLSVLPSYTQLGMAALLPGKKLGLVENKGAVSAELAGQPTSGMENRRKILQSVQQISATALQSVEFMAMKADEVRALIRDHDVLYLYHNHIDATGHDTKSESRVFIAAEEAMQDLLKMIKKLTGNNVNNILLTADHGFIYQHRKIEESDFAVSEIAGEKILHKDRRFVVGKGLRASDSLKCYKTSDLGLEGDLEIQIPKSINRLRLSGACMQFVHGGQTLQETVLPVLKINKKRQSDVSWVDVEILRGNVNLITSSQLAVKLYQSQAVSEKLQPRVLRIGIYAPGGDLISNAEELVFDRTSEQPRDRETMVKLVMTQKADASNNQEVTLRLDEKIPGSNQYKAYKTLSYQLRRSFTSDFEF